MPPFHRKVIYWINIIRTLVGVTVGSGVGRVVADASEAWLGRAVSLYCRQNWSSEARRARVRSKSSDIRPPNEHHRKSNKQNPQRNPSKLGQGLLRTLRTPAADVIRSIAPPAWPQWPSKRPSPTRPSGCRFRLATLFRCRRRKRLRFGIFSTRV